MRNEKGYPAMNKVPVTTRIGVRRIVIEVNRDLTIEQLGMLDDTLQRLGLIKTTRVTLHNQPPHKPHPQRTPPAKKPVPENNQSNVQPEVRNPQTTGS
jgi:hypothetical protein